MKIPNRPVNPAGDAECMGRFFLPDFIVWINKKSPETVWYSRAHDFP
jgi:hypothetical protein